MKSLLKSLFGVGQRQPEEVQKLKDEVQKLKDELNVLKSLFGVGQRQQPEVSRALTDKQVKSFFDNGYLVLPKFYTDDEVELVNRAVDRAWSDRSIYNNLTISAFTGTARYTESYLRKIDPSARQFRHKLNFLYLYDAAVLHLLLSDKLQNALARLLDGTPFLFNGLNMEHGTEQRYHIDTFYMPPRTFGKMVATWMALEDIHPDSGPLQYYPGSHLIPPYRFSHGEIWAKSEEMANFDRYYEPELAKRGLKSEQFFPKKGDMFIWHAQLYHGGGKINNRALTRKSMVNHFWTVEDYPEQALEVMPGKYVQKQQNMFVATEFTEQPAA
jgi:ectoine hydroxylase-related dioxygenase (phytanoyl-CoA dioxygenase family)